MTAISFLRNHDYGQRHQTWAEHIEINAVHISIGDWNSNLEHLPFHGLVWVVGWWWGCQ